MTKQELEFMEKMQNSITVSIPFESTLKGLDEAGIGASLTEEQREIIQLEDEVDAIHEAHSKLVLENMKLKEENTELKERLAEEDTNFGDIHYGSDRGNDMRNE